MADERAFVRFVVRLDAPRERVFAAWTDPAELVQWWGPGAFKVASATVDLRPGGDYRIVLEPPGGGEPLILGGRYREVVAPRRLVFTWRWQQGVPDERESLVTVEFRDLASGTEVVLVHDNFAGPGPVDGYRMGWDSGLQKLASHLQGEEEDVPEATHETTIARPPETVFAFLADPENDRAWRPGVLEIAHVSGTGVGSRYRQVVGGPGGRRIDADIEITEHEPDSRLGFRTVAGPVRPSGRYELEPVEGGGTRVRFTLAARLSGLKKAIGPMVKKTMESEVANLERLKQTLEA
jgi:uncharacterized protein YndB with AHSA1/START domain